MKERIRLLIADDHPVVRSGLRGIFESEPDLEVLGEAKTGAEAADLALRLRPDVVPDGSSHAPDGRGRGHGADKGFAFPDPDPGC